MLPATQANVVIPALFRAVRMPALLELWTEEGPTREAVSMLGAGFDELPKEQATIMRLAFDLYRVRQGDVRLADVMMLDARVLSAVASLLAAFGDNADLDRWIEKHSR